MLEELHRLIDEVLNPLLHEDASSMQLVRVDAAEDVVRERGRAAIGDGAEDVRSGGLAPALRQVVGDEPAIRIEKTVPAARRRA